jgi:hypothetical protein
MKPIFKAIAFGSLAATLLLGEIALADDPIVGSWSFYNGDIRNFLPNGKCTGGNSGKGIVNGGEWIATWNRDNPNQAPAKYTIKYLVDGYVDHVTLNTDSTFLDGRSNHKAHVTASKMLEIGIPAAETTSEPDALLLETLSRQAPNASAWVLAPLDQSVPSDIRQNVTYLREDLLDEAAKEPKTGPETYKLGAQFCDALIAALDERDRMLARAGFRAAEANARTGVTSEALEARRNYKMSWPQYARENAQRAEIKSQAITNAKVMAERPKLEWSQRTDQIRPTLDGLYKQFRASMRQSAPAKQ